MPTAMRLASGIRRRTNVYTGALLVTAAALAAPAAAGASPEVPRPPASPHGTVPDRVTGATVEGGLLVLQLACGDSGTLEPDSAASAAFVCRGGRATVRVPASVLRRDRAGRRAAAVRIRAGRRLTTATVGLDARMGRRTARASAAYVPTPGVMTTCYQRTASSGGGGFQSVSINMNETFARANLLDTVYWQAYIYRSSIGTWASSTVDYYTIYRGGWSSGGYDAYDPRTGYTIHTIGGTTLNPWKSALWIENGYWTAKYIPPRTYTMAAVHVWRPGRTASMYYASTNRTGYDPVWCYYS